MLRAALERDNLARGLVPLLKGGLVNGDCPKKHVGRGGEFKLVSMRWPDENMVAANFDFRRLFSEVTWSHLPAPPRLVPSERVWIETGFLNAGNTTPYTNLYISFDILRSGVFPRPTEELLRRVSPETTLSFVGNPTPANDSDWPSEAEAA